MIDPYQLVGRICVPSLIFLKETGLHESLTSRTLWIRTFDTDPQKGELEYVTNRENIQTLDVVSGRNQPPWIPETWKHGKPLSFRLMANHFLKKTGGIMISPSDFRREVGRNHCVSIEDPTPQEISNYNSILKFLGKSRGLGKTHQIRPHGLTPLKLLLMKHPH